MLASSHVISRFAAAALVAAASAALVSCQEGEEEQEARYNQMNLVSDSPGAAAYTDANLKGPRGIAYGESTPFWVANHGNGKATVYDGRGKPAPIVVTIPPPEGSRHDAMATPTGAVYSGSDGFVVGAGDRWGPARFLFATEDGTIAGWNPDVSASRAFLGVYCHKKATSCPQEDAVYKGLAIGQRGGDALLYATNFAAGTVDVFDEEFSPVDLGRNAFKDPGIPAGYAPFGIQAIDGTLYVTYAKQDGDRRDAVEGPGNGYVNHFRMDGRLIRRIAAGGVLDAPWGLARAPEGFGPFSGMLLVGNHGDGRVHAFDMKAGASCGALADADGEALMIPGLWALIPGNGELAGDENKVYFTAGIAGEKRSLFGALAHVDDP